MTDVLAKIIDGKRDEVAALRATTSLANLEAAAAAADPVRRGIVYFANPDLDGILWQFDADGEERGSCKVQDLFAQLESRLTETR